MNLNELKWSDRFYIHIPIIYLNQFSPQFTLLTLYIRINDRVLSSEYSHSTQDILHFTPILRDGPKPNLCQQCLLPFKLYRLHRGLFRYQRYRMLRMRSKHLQRQGLHKPLQSMCRQKPKKNHVQLTRFQLSPLSKRVFNIQPEPVHMRRFSLLRKVHKLRLHPEELHRDEHRTLRTGHQVQCGVLRKLGTFR